MALQDDKDGRVSVDGDASSTGIGQSRPIRRGRFSLAVDQEPSSFAATPSASNADFDPIPPSKRTWGVGAYIAYWMADAWAVSNWEVGMCRILCNLFGKMRLSCGADHGVQHRL